MEKINPTPEEVAMLEELYHELLCERRHHDRAARLLEALTKRWGVSANARQLMVVAEEMAQVGRGQLKKARLS